MKFKHNDSFRLMQYTCQKCGHIEFIWNGRDNVSPFSVECSKCQKGGMNHTNWHLDRQIPDYKPPTGSRYFVDYTPERAELAANKILDAAIGTRYEVKGGEREKIKEKLIEQFLTDCCSMDIMTAQ